MGIARRLVLSERVGKHVLTSPCLPLNRSQGTTLLRDAANLPGVDFASESDDVVVSYGVVTAPSYPTSSVVADILPIGRSEKGFVSQFAYEISKHRCYEREMDGLTAKVAF